MPAPPQPKAEVRQGNVLVPLPPLGPGCCPAWPRPSPRGGEQIKYCNNYKWYEGWVWYNALSGSFRERFLYKAKVHNNRQQVGLDQLNTVVTLDMLLGRHFEECFPNFAIIKVMMKSNTQVRKESDSFLVITKSGKWKQYKLKGSSAWTWATFNALVNIEIFLKWNILPTFVKD